MLDFSQEIKLDQKNHLLYRKLQIMLYLAAVFLAVLLSYLIIFPHKYFFFSFLEPNSSKNTLDMPYFSDDRNIEKGKIFKEEKLFFDASIANTFSSVKLNLDLKNPTDLSPEVSVRKSYKAFFYPTEKTIGFKNGSLLKNGEEYFLVSNEQLRKFSSLGIMSNLGYSKDSFLEISKDDLGFVQFGEDISKTEHYPDFSLFKIEDNFYILENQKLKKFLSDRAFFSNYNENQAIQKSSDFLQNYPLSENLAGFSDGTLVSNDISVYIISQNKIFPIDNPETFEGNGYLWEDVVPIGSDELAFHEKSKLFNIRSPHPTGTIFKTIENSKYFIIGDKQKFILPSENIATSWLAGKNPISVHEKSLEITSDCKMQKKLFQKDTLQCQIPLEKLMGFLGFDYQFKVFFSDDIQIDLINIDFKKDPTVKNFNFFGKSILNQIITRYVNR